VPAVRARDMTTIRIPCQLRNAVEEDDYAKRCGWLAALPERVAAVASEWELHLGEPFIPGPTPDGVRDRITRPLLRQAPELADRLRRKPSGPIRFIGM